MTGPPTYWFRGRGGILAGGAQCTLLRYFQWWAILGLRGGEEQGIWVCENDIHIVPVRFKPSTSTFIGRVRTEGSVSTRRGFGDAMMALVELDTAVEVLDVY